METFDFPFHNFQARYEETSTSVRFGNGWEFASAPQAPDQRSITLSFSGMQYYHLANGSLDTTGTPQRNAWVLEQFYRRHGTWKPFTYVHPLYGSLKVRFRKPLELPRIKGSGHAVLEDFSVELLELLQ